MERFFVNIGVPLILFIGLSPGLFFDLTSQQQPVPYNTLVAQRAVYHSVIFLVLLLTIRELANEFCEKRED